MKAIGYVRVSTKEQGAEDKFGKVAQKQAIRDYAKVHGYEIVAWFEDVASGVSDERPEWNKVLVADDITNPPFEAVIVFKSDRVARDIQLYFYYSYLLRRKGVELIAVNDGFTEVPNEYKNIIKSFVVFSAEQERKNIALRTSHGRKIKAVNGGYAGGGIPYGYKVVKGRLEVDEYESSVVKNIFSMYEDNISQVKIAKYLNDNGITTKFGKSWTQPQVHYILNNRKLYQGFIKYGKDAHWVKGVHTPII